MDRLYSRLNDGLDDRVNDGCFDEIIRWMEKRKNVIGEIFLIRFQDE